MNGFAPSLADCLLVAMGGAIGSVARFLVSGWIGARTAGTDGFPWGTFAVNMVGCFLLGALMTATLRRPDVWWGWRPLLGVGFLGGFTTFSTLLWDAYRLGPRLGALNLLGSTIAGLAAVWLAAQLIPRSGP